MKRREMLAASGAALVGLSAFPFGWTAAAEPKKQKLLYFTRSAGYEHGAVKRNGDELGVGTGTQLVLTRRCKTSCVPVSDSTCSKFPEPFLRSSRCGGHAYVCPLGR